MVNRATISASDAPGRPAGAHAAESLATVVYRSRAVRPLSGPDLHALIQSAAARNAREQITGVIVYDNQTFFQCLEGPAENVARLMHSIHKDQRHTEIDVLNNRPAAGRLFADWSMKLATRDQQARPQAGEVLEPPPEIMRELHQHPAAVPALLVKLAALPDVPATSLPGTATQLANQARSASILEGLIRASVIPQLLAAHPAPAAPKAAWQIDPRTPELVQLLVHPDPDQAASLIRAQAGSSGAAIQLLPTLLEPAARGLGDLWIDDLCSDLDMSLGLYRLQSALRLLHTAPPHFYDGATPPPAVLIVPEPGELHMLGAAFDSDALLDAGWSPQSAFPQDDRALEELLDNEWFDALDLSLSTALPREHLLPRVRETIIRARRASRNPALLVVVGGRVFGEQDDAGARVGADAASGTALDVEQAILRGLRSGR